MHNILLINPEFPLPHHHHKILLQFLWSLLLVLLILLPSVIQCHDQTSAPYYLFPFPDDLRASRSVSAPELKPLGLLWWLPFTLRSNQSFQCYTVLIIPHCIAFVHIFIGFFLYYNSFQFLWFRHQISGPAVLWISSGALLKSSCCLWSSVSSAAGAQVLGYTCLVNTSVIAYMNFFRIPGWILAYAGE